MNRALPASVVVHLLMLLLVLVYGAWVNTPIPTLPQTISVSLQPMPRPPIDRQEEIPAMEAEPEEVAVQTTPPPEEFPTPVPEDALPDPLPEDVDEPRDITPPPEIERERETSVEPVDPPVEQATPQEQEVVTTLSGENITVESDQALTTEQNVVLQTLVARLTEEWMAVGPEVGGRSCIIRFSVDRSGALVNERFVNGSKLLKNQALLSVRRVGRINPHGWIGDDPWHFTVEMIAE